MGVPKFYRWLSERYPLINQAIDETTLLPEFDNLYLDMNGIIHNATHGNDGVSKRQTEKDVVLTMMAYIDNMVKIIKPVKLLYMAIDGVAPRAKMNQQRSRRFRAARDLAQARIEAAARGEAMADDEVFDSNCITPGTPFMAALGELLCLYIEKKIKEDPMWTRTKQIVFSGHDVPGEGEHKIVQWIRGAKLRPDWDPNTRHCMAGLDADLIMLSLATHEPHFSLLREQVDFTAFKNNPFGTKTKTRATAATKWQLLHIGVLREYLEIDMRPAAPLPTTFDDGKGFDGERAVDDFVLIMAMCGNDFTPHLPSLDIGEGAIDHLLRTYRERLGGWGGWLCCEGLIDLQRVQALLAVMGAMEADVFKQRAEEAEAAAKRAKKDAKRNASAMGYIEEGAADVEDDGDDAVPREITAQAKAAAESDMLNAVAVRLAEERREAGLPDTDVQPFSLKDGDFKGRYYLDKFGITYKQGSERDEDVLRKIVQSFTEALQWVMLYYYRGVPSWGWFYPFHFAPMTSDLLGLDTFNLSFRLGRPFSPFQQLLGCLPAASGKFLPEAYHHLMIDPDSPILEFYPAVETIKVDMNGKRNSWEGVTLIPFIRERAMLDAIASCGVDASLTEEERHRNTVGVEHLFWHDPSALDTIVSTRPDLFPNIPLCQSRRCVLQSPRLPVLTSPGARPVRRPTGPQGGDEPDPYDVMTDPEMNNTIAVAGGMQGSASLFSARPCPGCIVPAPGFDTLHALPFVPSRIAVNINMFGMKSRKESIVLAIANGRRPVEDEEEEEDEALLGGASLFGDGVSLGPGLTPSPAPRKKHAVAPSHVPAFSVKYAPGTSVADGPDSIARDALSAFLAANEESGALPTARSMAPALLGHTWYAEWPHLREVLVVGICDGVEEITWTPATTAFGDDAADQAGSTNIQTLNVDEAVTWERAAEDLRTCTLAGGRGLTVAGVKVGDVPVTVTVRVLEGMRRDPTTGALTRVFAPRGSNGEKRILPHLLLPAHPVPDGRWVEKGPQTPASRFPVGAAVVALRGPARGCEARIVGYSSPTGVPANGLGSDDRLELDAEMPAPEPPFGHTVHGTIQDRYFDAKRACDALRISPQTLGRVTGSVIILPKKWDIGLNLKVHRTLFLPGYVRSTSSDAASAAWLSGTSADIAGARPMPGGGSGGWEYTERAITLVATYQKAYPEVFAMLEAYPHESAYNVRDVPGQGEGVVRLCTWLKQLETAKRPLVPVTTQVMCPPAIIAVQKAADSLAAMLLKKAAAAAGVPVTEHVKATRTERTCGVSPADVFRREEQAYAVGGVGEGEGTALASLNVDGPSCVPKLGDRVANLSFKAAPLGLRGTVVAVHSGSGYVEVVFDAEFVGGTTLGSLCGAGRGGLTPWSALLCLSRLPSELPQDRSARVGTTAARVASVVKAREGQVFTSEDAGGPVFTREDAGPRGRVHGQQGRGGGAGAGGYRQQIPAPAPAPTAPTPAPAAARAVAGPAGGRVAAGPGSAGTGFGRPQSAAQLGSGHNGTRPAADPAAIASQVEFYFSDSNLSSDKFMRQQFAKDASGAGWVDLSVIASFARMKTLAGGKVDVVASAIAGHSSTLLLSTDGQRVRRAVAWRPSPAGRTQPQAQGQGQSQGGAVANAPLATPSVPLYTVPAPAADVSQTTGPNGTIDMATYWRTLMAQPSPVQAVSAAPSASAAGSKAVPGLAASAAAPLSAFDQLLANLERMKVANGNSGGQ